MGADDWVLKSQAKHVGVAEAQRRASEPRVPPRALVSSVHVWGLLLVLLAGALITALPAMVHRRGDFDAITKLLPCVGDTDSSAAALPAIAAAADEAANAAPALPPLVQPRLPWPPLLTPEEQRRGISYMGSGTQLHALARKLVAGQPIKSFALGGSVTSGGGSSSSYRTAYVPKFFEFIRHNFPHEGHVLENKAIAASTAFMFAACLEHHVPPDADLVVLEFSVNEKPDAEYTSPERRSFERLIRRLRQLPGRPAVVVLHHYGWWNSWGDGVDRGLFYYQPELQLTAFSHYYDLPTLSLRSAAWHLMNAGVEHFKVHRVTMVQRPHMYFDHGRIRNGFIPATGEATKEQFFYVDATHPSDQGHQALAELLAGLVQRAVWEVQVPGGTLAPVDIRRDPAVPDLPPPMIPFSPDSLPGLCAMQEEFKPLVKNYSGFEYLPERPDASSFMLQKWGWRGTKPGDWAELEIDTRASDGSPHTDTYVWLSHLSSYAGMGTARVECVSGCKCATDRLDGTWLRQASLFTIMRFHVTRHKQCRFRVTVLPRPGKYPQKGHKVTLAAVMVTHVPLGMGAGESSLGLVENIGLTHDRGWKEEDR